jgi:hypothetical protein
MPQATTLYDIHNRPVFTIFKEYRIEVPLSGMSPNLRKAVVAFEDQRFEDHRGYDPWRIMGAAWADLRHGRMAQGGSTITQQLARQSFLTREKKYWRKLQEIALAIRIEQMYSKDEILELYLNKVYFGDGLYGVEAAARGYFGKSASDLDLAESALLVGVINAPSVNAPTVSLPRALARRALVLKAMHEQELISTEALDGATNEKVALRDILRREEPLGQYFKEEVRQQLVRQFGWERLSESGLRVYTTIDPEMQRAAEAIIETSVAQIEARRSKRRPLPNGERLEAALVSMDPATGEVRAMVGGRDYKASRFNRATQALRQVRLCRGAGERLHAGIARLASRRARQHAARRVDTGRRALGRGGHDGAHGASHVEQPGSGADARAGGNCEDGRSGSPHGHGQRAERALAGTRLGRGDADGNDLGVLGVRRSGPTAPADLHSTRRGLRRQRPVQGRAEVGSGGVAPDGVSHDQHAV